MTAHDWRPSVFDSETQSCKNCGYSYMFLKSRGGLTHCTPTRSGPRKKRQIVGKSTGQLKIVNDLRLTQNALRLAKSLIKTLAQDGTERLREAGVPADPAYKTYEHLIKRINRELHD